MHEIPHAILYGSITVSQYDAYIRPCFIPFSFLLPLHVLFCIGISGSLEKDIGMCLFYKVSNKKDHMEQIGKIIPSSSLNIMFLLVFNCIQSCREN
jgi:hypothetical protein